MSGVPALILAASLAAVDDAWIEARCCRGSTFIPIKMMAGQHGAQRRVGAVISQLRCRACGDRPAEVAIVQSPDHAAPGRAGAPLGWRIVLGRWPRSLPIGATPAGRG